MPDHEAIDQSFLDTSKVTVYGAAAIIRQAILSMRSMVPFPATPSDLAEHKVDVPNVLYNFLTWLMVGDNGVEAPSLAQKVTSNQHADHRRVLSIAQDVIFCTTKGQVKPPKHVALPVALKHITGSETVVTILNKLGHGASQSQLSEWDAATAEKQLQEQQHQAAFIPSNIDPTSYVTFCWDNNDILEETASGLGTTHCTNGIVVQRCVDSCAPPPPTGPHQPGGAF